MALLAAVRLAARHQVAGLVRQETKRGAVARADGAEVAAIEGDDQIGVESLGERDDRGVRATEREVAVLLDQTRDSGPVVGGRSTYIERFQTPKKPRFSDSTHAMLKEVRHLSHHQSWDN
jgi:hypothetical protein